MKNKELLDALKNARDTVKGAADAPKAEVKEKKAAAKKTKVVAEKPKAAAEKPKAAAVAEKAKPLAKVEEPKAESVIEKPQPEPESKKSKSKTVKPKVEKVTEKAGTNTFQLPIALVKKMDNVRGSWAKDAIIASIVENALNAYPELKYSKQLICAENTFRTFERKNGELLINNGEKTHCFKVNQGGRLYKEWLKYYRKKKPKQAESQAQDMCLYDLEVKLQEFDDYKDSGWKKPISTTDYILA